MDNMNSYWSSKGFERQKVNKFLYMVKYRHFDGVSTAIEFSKMASSIEIQLYLCK